MPFSDLIARFTRCRILVVGDLMLDHYVKGDVRRISPEAPVPVVEHAAEDFLPGGAANVARNLAALGARVSLFGVVGHDAAAGQLRRSLRTAGIGGQGLLVERERPTTVKMRILAGHQQMIRVDRESRAPLSPGGRRVLQAALRQGVHQADAIVVADYAKGVVDQEMMDLILDLGRRHDVPVCVDPKPVRPLAMKGCALLTPNRRETFELAGLADESIGPRPAEHAGLRRAITAVRRRHAPAGLLVTLGEGGLLVVDQTGRTTHLPTVARDVFDVSGAGDTVIAVAALAQAAGAVLLEAATLANHAAGLVVAKLGTACVTTEELVQSLETSR